MDEITGMMSDEAADRDSTALTLIRSPTRRRLVGLLASLPAFITASDAMAVPSVADTESDARPNAISDLFTAFEALLAKHEAALWRCDRLEAFLLAELDYPRVRLPLPSGFRVRYAADVDTIIRFIPPGRRRWRLQEVLLRRQRAWTRGACACGLTKAQEQEAVFDAAVRDAAATLLVTPANTLVDVHTKLLVLLASQDPGGTFHDAPPWSELRRILADLAHLMA